MSTFIFDKIQPSSDQKLIVFTYKLQHKNKTYSFEEQVRLPDNVPEDIPKGLLQQLLQGLHLILGISYWKLYCPKEITIQEYTLTKKQAEFWNAVYTKGLGEFYYQNSIDFRGLVSFPYSDDTTVEPVGLVLQDRSLVGVGGGKDSIVTAELLKQHAYPFDAFVVETQKPYPLVDQVVEKLGTDKVIVQRQIDPQLFELNARDDTYNGHIPISAVYAFLGVLCAVLYDYSSVVFSNERTASVGNVEYLGETVNHQWSKSHEFELMTREYIHSYITPEVDYVSLLRPFSEYQIVEMFSKYPEYFHLFSSCNRNFNIQTENTDKLWCCECPKCAFVFVLLSVFFPKDQMIDLFGENLLDKESLVPVYKELLGLQGFKPFECVGTPDEVQLALFQIHKKGEYEGDVVMKLFVDEVLPEMDVEKVRDEVCRAEKEVLPEKWRRIL